MDVAWALFWEKAGARNLMFFRVKWLRPAMKGTLCMRRVRTYRFGVYLFPHCCCGFQLLWLHLCVCVTHLNRCKTSAYRVLLFIISAGECGMIVGPHSTKLPQSWDTGSDQPSVPAFFTFRYGKRPSQEPPPFYLFDTTWLPQSGRLLYFDH